MDNSDQLVVFTADLTPRGVPRHVGDLRAITLSARHDYEDLVVCPPAILARLPGRPPSADDVSAAGPHLLICVSRPPADCEPPLPAHHHVRLDHLASPVEVVAGLVHVEPDGMELVA